VLFVAYTFSFIDRYILSLLIQPIKQDLGLSDTRVSLLHGLAFAIFYTVMGIPIGRLADRYSRRLIISAGIAAWSMMTAACGLARGFWQLFAARVGVGVGEAALSPAAYSMIADLFPPHKLGRAMSIYSAGAVLGGGLAFIIGGTVIQAISQTPDIALPLIGTVRTWQLSFFIVGLPGLLVALLMWTVKEPRRHATSTVGTGQDDTPALSQVLRYLLSSWRVYGPHFLGFSMLAVVFNAMLAWTPAFLSRTFDMPVGQAGPAIGFLLLSFGVAGILAGGWLADRLLAKGFKDATLRTGIVAGIGAFPFAVLAPLMPSSFLSLLLFAPLWFFSTSGFGAAVAALQHVTPNRMRGITSACYLFSGNLLGVGLGPTAIALITDYSFGYDQAVRYSMAIVGGSCAILAVVFLLLGLRPFRELAEARLG
jgi:MFS family permease